MSPTKELLNCIFNKNSTMRKFLTKLDFTLLFRLSLSVTMLIAAIRQSDKVAGAFGLFLAFYALVAAKYKVGCGYNKC
jgi:predicted anti-sigma-YlaC factor YlaD